MAQSGSPLKSMEEIELANDYVMESGLISCQTDDDVDPAVMNIKLVAPPSEEVASVPKKEEPFVVPLSIPVLPLTAKADGEKLEGKTMDGGGGGGDSNIFNREKLTRARTMTIRGIQSHCSDFV